MNRRQFLARAGQATALALGASSGLFGSRIFAQQRKTPPQLASGPLRVSARNPRYFCDASGREVLLTGSHTWNTLVDMGRSDPPEAFDFDAYLDNVLYEVINEGGEKEWDWWVVDTVRKYERTQPHQHPVGITGHGAERVECMLASPADWISPGSQDGYKDDPPAWAGKRVSLLDTVRRGVDPSVKRQSRRWRCRDRRRGPRIHRPFRRRCSVVSVLLVSPVLRIDRDRRGGSTSSATYAPTTVRSARFTRRTPACGRRRATRWLSCILYPPG